MILTETSKDGVETKKDMVVHKRREHESPKNSDSQRKNESQKSYDYQLKVKGAAEGELYNEGHWYPQKQLKKKPS